MTDDCSQNTDPLKLVREGTSRDDRATAALDPATAPVNARGVADNIVFARNYAGGLKHYGPTNTVTTGGWRDFFSGDAAVPLAVAAIEDIESYKTAVRSWFDFLNDLKNAGQANALKDNLGYLFAAVGSLARALDHFTHSLPDTVALKGTTQNLIRMQLQPALTRLIGYYRGGEGLAVINDVAPAAMKIFGDPVIAFDAVLTAGLSKDWTGTAATWTAYLATISADASVYGPGGAPDPFVRINHCSTHNLFRSVFDQFLRVFARVGSEAQGALDDLLTAFPGHTPHYALYLAFLQLAEYARAAGNRLTQKHLDFYYRVILGLKESPAQPGHVHLTAELAKQAVSFDFASGALFKAGKDSTGKDAFFANTADFVANKATIAGLKTVYRHGTEPIKSGDLDNGRLFASPVANSDDGQGAPLTSVDKSWQPFFNKVYTDGNLSEIDMPLAKLGFAIASHYLYVAEGTRKITLQLNADGTLPASAQGNFTAAVQCWFTTAKGWLQKAPVSFVHANNSLELVVQLEGADDPIVPYVPKVHGYNFDTGLPILLVTLVQDVKTAYAYPALQDVKIATADLTVDVKGMKTLPVATDFGPVDLSKPFQPFGSSPARNSTLVIGSNEIFQKKLTGAEVDITWQAVPVVFTGTSMPTVSVDFLKGGVWTPSSNTPVSIAPASGNAIAVSLTQNLADPVVIGPDFTPDAPYTTQARHGFLRLVLSGDIGQAAYQAALITYLLNAKTATSPGPTMPPGPMAAALTMSYVASTELTLSSSTPSVTNTGQFFHLGPFGTAEQQPYLTGGNSAALLPQFAFAPGVNSEAEFYIGIAGLAPPQSIAILFEVVDGTANPLSIKPVPHFDWCYLANNRWVEFPENAVSDGTGELLDSGIVTFAVPAEATADNTLFPAGMYWIRAAVASESDAVCRLQLVAAQAMEAVFADQGNAPNFSAAPLPAGTISKLAVPDSAVKSVSQPFASFGGRGAELSQDFYQRISERLRHKDRAIDLWDYERLILQAFPQIYKVKCLNHTQFEPADNSGGSGPCSGGIYRELAPGHVTIITLPNLQTQHERDPLKPYTSLGLLTDIGTFLAKRTSCLAKLHVKNPQFEEIRVAFNVKLFDGYDAAYYKIQLQQAITRFLSPWAFTGDGVPSFGGKVYQSVLVNFVEEQPYVDYVTDFQMFQDIPCQPKGTQPLDEAAGSRAVSILVSAPASAHAVTVLEVAPDPELAESCGCDA